MIKGIHYEEAYAPVVAWATIRFFLTLAVINNWHTRQLDFLLAFTQADIEQDLYMRLPAGFVIPGKTLTDEDRKVCAEVGKETVWAKASRKSLVSTLEEESTQVGIQGKQHR
jgi:hypothetical protein